jgi:DNA-binding beta-propeller fold protein YncE
MLRMFDTSNSRDTVAVFSPDGRYILTAGSCGWCSCQKAELWDVATGNRAQTFQGPKDAIRSLAFSDDGKRLTVGYMEGWGTQWGMGTGKPVGKVRVAATSDDEWRNPQVPSEYKSPDGRWVVKVNESNNTVVLTDTRTRKKTTILDYREYTPVRAAFTSKIPRMAVADEGSVHIFNLETGKELATLISAYGSRDWLVMTPGNYFDGSPGGRTLIRWQVGEAEYPCGRFETQFRRPDMVAKILEGQPDR